MARPRNKSKTGVTLLEVLIAGGMITILTLSLLEGFTLAAKICHENAEVLRADNVAFDLLWCQFHRKYEGLSEERGRPISNDLNVQIPYTTSGLISETNSCLRIFLDLYRPSESRPIRALSIFRSSIDRNLFD